MPHFIDARNIQRCKARETITTLRELFPRYENDYDRGRAAMAALLITLNEWTELTQLEYLAFDLNFHIY